MAEPLGRGEAYCAYHTDQAGGIIEIHDESDDEEDGKCIVCGAEADPNSLRAAAQTAQSR